MVIGFVFLLIMTEGYYGFNENDIQVVVSLLRPFAIKQCLLVVTVHDPLSMITSKMKMLSEENISTVYFDITGLGQYLEMGKFPNAKTAIVFKITDEDHHWSISKMLKTQNADRNVCSKFVWLVLPHESNANFDSFEVPYDCQFLIISETGTKYKLTEIFKTHKRANLTTTDFGYYYINQGLKRNENYLIRDNLMGREMVLVIPNEGVRLFAMNYIHFDLWQDMGKLLNYSTQAIKRKDVIDAKSKADAYLIQAFYHLTKNPNRMIGPSLTARAHMYIKTIEDNQKFWTAYLHPFSKSVWSATCCWILISSTATMVIGYLTSRVLQLQGFTLLDQVLIPITALCNQGCMNLPQIISIRIAIICAFLVSGVILPGYSASSTSFLTIDKTKLPFTDFETFAKDKTYKLASLNNLFFISFFEDNEDKIVKTIREKYLISYSDFPVTHQDCVNMLCKNDKLAIINLNYKVLQIWSPCKITIIPNELMRINFGFTLVNDGFQYKKLFHKLLIKFRSAGIISRAHRILFGKTDFSIPKEYTPIEISVIESLLAVLACGTVSSVISFTLELLHYRYSICTTFGSARKSRAATAVADTIIPVTKLDYTDR